MSDNKPTVVTQVQEVDYNLENLLQGTGASAGNVLLPSGGDKKPGIFSANPPNLTFLDNPGTTVKEGGETDPPAKEPEGGAPATPAKPAVTAANPNPDPDPDDDDEDDDDPNAVLNGITETPDDGKDKPGRKKVTRDLMLQVIGKLVEKGTLMPFDDEKPMEEYSNQDLEDLLEENFKARELKIKEQATVDFFDSQPEEFQIALKYLGDGGQDIKGLFYALAQVQESHELTPTTDSAEIARRYLQATNFGSAEDIEEEITSWKDLGKLEEKATKFKPKLDAMNEQIVANKLKHQEQLRNAHAKQAKDYMENVYKVLEPAEINGLKLDKKTQGMLYAGLVNATYPSMSGRNTNYLGHLLEKHQVHEPNHALVAEALWLLADPDGYRAKVRESAEKASTEKAVRLLKTEQQNRNGSGTGNPEDKDDKRTVQKPGTIKRPSTSFFSR